MTFRSLFIAFWFVGTSFAVTPSSHAQEATLYCRSNEALVRFSTEDRNYPLPAAAEAAWAKVAPSKNNRCVLSNGQTVVMRFRQTQGTPFGMAGADREAAFSLWIDRKKVISREEHRPHPVAAPRSRRMSHLLYTSGTVELCRFALGDEYDNRVEGISCDRRKTSLDQLRPDPLEPIDDSRVGTITIAAALNADLCESFVLRKGAIRSPEEDDGIRLGRTDDGDRLRMAANGRNFPFESPKTTTLSVRDQHYAATSFDIFGTGEMHTMVQFVGTSAVFYGNFLMVREGVASEAEIMDLIQRIKLGFMEPEEIRKLQPNGWHMLQAGPDKYTTHTVIAQGGSTFIMAMPFEEQSAPDAVLFKLEPGYATHFPVCTFQSVWPNF